MNTVTSRPYDLVIVGAGPCGLAAGLVAARAGWSTLILERGQAGGHAALTRRIDNFPGFARGIGGLELAERLIHHAERFGAVITAGSEVTGLRRNTGSLTVSTAAGKYPARSVLIATGTTYRRLGVPGEASFDGRGLHYCARCDAPLYRGRDIVVAAGSDTAPADLQFIAKFARHLTIVTPADRGSISAIAGLTHVELAYQSRITAVTSHNGRVTGADIAGPHATTKVPAAAVFVLGPAQPNSQPFAGLVHTDRDQYVMTDINYATTLPGVFAAGCVRAGASSQIAAVVGEGAAAAQSISNYLAGL